MKAASGALIALLNGNNTFLMADLLTIALRVGGTLRWSLADSDISFGGNTFTAPTDNGTQPLAKRGSVRTVKGLEVDVMDLTLYGGSTARLSGISLSAFAHNGGFDGARVKLERVFMPTWGDTTPGSVVLFEGNVAGVEPSSTQVALKVKSDLELLTRPWPQTVFQPGCANAFGDPNCGKNLAALTDTGTAGAGTNATQVNVGTGHADGYYNLGVLTMTSGLASGAQRAVKTYLSGIVTLAIPLPATAAPGDTFSVYPGCARSKAACSTWANLDRFRGFPFVPPPETTR